MLWAVLSPAKALAEDPCHAPEGAPVARVEVSGLAEVKTGTVEEALQIRPGVIVSALSVEKLEALVLGLGWFSQVNIVLQADSGDCVLKVRVEEYPLIRAVVFEGASAYEKGAALTSQIASQPGRRGNRITAETDALAIANLYHDDGYDAARVVGVDLASGVVTFHVREGHISRIDVVGATRTGKERVKEILGIKPGQLYDSGALVAGQAALYRTGLFSNVGFGVETPGASADPNDDGIVLTVMVGELNAPFSRTTFFADPGQTLLYAEARMRNLANGHSVDASATVLGPSPSELAAVGFDDFYRAELAAATHLYHPREASPGLFFGLEAELVHGRNRSDLGLLVDLATPAARAGLSIPVVGSEDWEGVGSLSAIGGVRQIHTTDSPGSKAPVFDTLGGYGRAELGFELRRLAGVETPVHAVIRTGVEYNASARPISFLEGSGEARTALAQGVKLEGAADFGALTGDPIPFWRDYALDGASGASNEGLSGAGGPLGFPREYAFTEDFARARGDVVFSAVRDLVAVAGGAGGAVWAPPPPLARVLTAKSVHVEVRAGPPYARVRAGVAAPLPGAGGGDLWWYVGVSIATPQ